MPRSCLQSGLQPDNFIVIAVSMLTCLLVTRDDLWASQGAQNADAVAFVHNHMAQEL